MAYKVVLEYSSHTGWYFRSLEEEGRILSVDIGTMTIALQTTAHHTLVKGRLTEVKQETVVAHIDNVRTQFEQPRGYVGDCKMILTLRELLRFPSSEENRGQSEFARGKITTHDQLTHLMRGKPPSVSGGHDRRFASLLT